MIWRYGIICALMQACSGIIFNNVNNLVQNIAEDRASDKKIITLQFDTPPSATPTLVQSPATGTPLFKIVTVGSVYEVWYDFASGGPLDYDVSPTQYVLSLTAVDGGNTASATLTMRLTNVNEAPTISVSTPLYIFESETVSKTLTTFTSSDPDAGDAVTWTIDVSPPNTAFDVDPNTGAFKISSQLGPSPMFDYETTNSYTVTVTAMDLGGLTEMKTVAIVIRAVEEAPSLSTSSVTTYVSENTVSQTLLYTLSAIASDPENSALTYQQSSASPSPSQGGFTTDSSSGDVWVQSGTPLDFETVPFYLVVVKISDVAASTTTLTITVSVNDVNEAPRFTNLPFTTSILESANSITDMHRCSVSDPDGTTAYNWQFTSNPANGQNKFLLDSNGVLTTTSNPGFNYATVAIYRLTILASDQATTNPLTATGTLTIAITDDPGYVGPTASSSSLNAISGSGSSDGTTTNGLSETAVIILCVVGGFLALIALILLAGLCISKAQNNGVENAESGSRNRIATRERDRSPAPSYRSNYSDAPYDYKRST